MYISSLLNFLQTRTSTVVIKDLNEGPIIPPLNAGINFSETLPRHQPFNQYIPYKQQPLPQTNNLLKPEAYKVNIKVLREMGVESLKDEDNIYDESYMHLLDDRKTKIKEDFISGQKNQNIKTYSPELIK